MCSPCKEDATDVCFAGTGDGTFSVQEIFREIEGYDDSTIDEDWLLIWKLEVPERYRGFLWLLKHDRLLINFSKSKKGLGSASCELCGAVNETTLHALRDCRKIVQVWRSFVPSDIMNYFFRLELKDWITSNLKYIGIGNENWNCVWATACHTLWNWRNKEVHSDNFVPPYDPIITILQRRKDYEKAFKLQQYLQGENGRRDNIHWQPLVEDMLKLNTDYASKNSGIAGCGGLVRNHKGTWIKGFTKFLGNCNALLAEFWGVFEGLKLTKALGVRRVEINVDSIMVKIAIGEGSIKHIECVAILRKIKQLIVEHEVVIISHSYREVNRCADMLANHGCSMKDSRIFYEFPVFLKPLLEDDALGIFRSLECDL